MSKIKIALGTAFLAAICLSAFSAASASALSISLEKCTKEAGTGTFTSGTCTVAGAGEFHKKTITSASAEIYESSPFTLETTNAGVEFEIKCEKVGGTTTLTDAGEVITSSAAPLTFSGCTVVKPKEKGCVVKAGGGATGTIITNNVISETTRTGTESYVTLYKPSTGTTFVTIEVSGCSASALNGNKAVTGTAKAVLTGGGMKAEFTTTSGTSLEFGGQVVKKFTGTAKQRITGTVEGLNVAP